MKRAPMLTVTAALATVSAMASMPGCAASTARPAEVTSPVGYSSGSVAPTGAMTAQVVSGDVIEPGTQLTLRLNQDVGTEMSQPGQRFTAAVVTPVIDAQGRPIIPAGAEVLGYVHGMREGNQTGSAPVLSLAFDAVRVAGAIHPIQARVVSADTETTRRGIRGRHTAAGAGGGALLGALTGGVEGALIGGALGAGAGAGTSYLTADRHVRIPAGGHVVIQMENSVPVTALRGGFDRNRAYGGGPRY